MGRIQRVFPLGQNNDTHVKHRWVKSSEEKGVIVYNITKALTPVHQHEAKGRLWTQGKPAIKPIPEPQLGTLASVFGVVTQANMPTPSSGPSSTRMSPQRSPCERAKSSAPFLKDVGLTWEMARWPLFIWVAFVKNTLFKLQLFRPQLSSCLCLLPPKKEDPGKEWGRRKQLGDLVVFLGFRAETIQHF